MAYSGDIGVQTFNALKVIDHAFRRCRLPAQAITAEMQSYAIETLDFMLSELGNIKTPSWCIQKLVLPMYENQPIVTLPLGTVELLNLNYRTIQPVTGANAITSTSYSVNFTSATVVNTVGIKWSGASVPVTFSVSTDNVTWVVVGTSSDTVAAGEITWTDISGALPYQYFKVSSTSPLLYSVITMGNMPQEIPLGLLNRDAYVQQSNKVFPNRPNSYWFQRDIPRPVINLWPAPFAASVQAQLVVWRHRQIMDTKNLQYEIEAPRRWYEAIVNGLASRVALETPSVDANLIPVLEGRATLSMQRAWDGDNDGSPIQINPGIGVYTK